ncbi:FAD-dependent monooxygenase [Nocardia cyriacigeorgica]|uniref:FAD-dependent monooxygenase n=1 Tax=Nocardia cyriacigeorgica TaxID=135487 RepID=UPI0018951141|nr:FAD-dependent monooxygenase [Nocardia cyriacigeorgica]MBF6101677.1 FAD-dependent monooxygenase [Nocardia cyriacigeorgica]MBF6158936.1 FAD-dependent monooxygenase [Nocardia cyriacigeorgica]MBF6197378.1 FAD-dependent monooxygenase [Nocardia cyriacigeorgica]MBF6344370.1 FAD-dependent monooxygenase [Nocardia cyriacigeorgica]
MSTAVRRVMIAGGGIGGLSAALALRRRGIDAVVFESARQLRDGGAGLHIWSNGMLALDALGVAEEVLRIAPVQTVCQFRTARGERIGSWPVGEFAAKYGRPTVAIGRSDLHRILLRALTDTEIRTGAEVTGFDQDGAGVTVRFADGGSERGELLIGADGVHSAVRRALVGDQPPRYTGYIAWRGAASVGPEIVAPGTFCAFFGPGTRFTYYDVAPGRTYWMSVANGEPHGVDHGDVIGKLVDRHRGWPEPVAQLLTATPAEQVLRHDVIDRAPIRRWGRGRVSLLGDAAHPITFNIGQGACQAIEDALILAEHLDGAADTIAALRSYERERIPRTARMQRMAWRIGRMGAWENPAAIWLRERFMKASWDRFAFRAAEQEQVAYATRYRADIDRSTRTNRQELT